MLTTIDNPFNPFKQFDDWLVYDEMNGHYSSSLLARVAYHSDELSDADQEIAIENAIDEIIKDDATLQYRKVSETDS
jgi:hypothetical protein